MPHALYVCVFPCSLFTGQLRDQVNACESPLPPSQRCRCAPPPSSRHCVDKQQMTANGCYLMLVITQRAKMVA